MKHPSGYLSIPKLFKKNSFLKLPNLLSEILSFLKLFLYIADSNLSISDISPINIPIPIIDKGENLYASCLYSFLYSFLPVILYSSIIA